MSDDTDKSCTPKGPSRAIPRLAAAPEEATKWFRDTFGNMPAPTADMDPKDASDHEPDRDRRRDALAALERTVPPVYRWARFGVPELAARTGGASDRALAKRIWRHPRLILMGPARVGKTSLAVACLRRWAADSGKAAGFFHAYRLGVARIQHQAGHGEPEIVDSAMKLPMVLLDDVGSERDTAANALPDVIFERHAEDRPLWVTTGLSKDQLVVRYGEGIVGRLFERASVIRMGAEPRT
jgi:hypothetical protein